jgi:hypothetical protein
MSIFDAATFFSRQLVPTVTGRNTQRRVPFSFTSTQRLLKAGLIGHGNSRELATQKASATLADELNVIEGTAALDETTGLLGVSSVLSVIPTMPTIEMMVNPHTIKWTQNKRFTKRDTMESSVFYHFSNKAGQNNDILTMHFSGNTGNINTADIFSATAVAGDIKLRMWHELYALTRERILLDGGVKNEFFISYRTVLFPIPITFIGFFNNVLEFTETAHAPLAREYSFTFTVTNTSPSLDVVVDKINSALSLTSAVSAARQIIGK